MSITLSYSELTDPQLWNSFLEDNSVAEGIALIFSTLMRIDKRLLVGALRASQRQFRALSNTLECLRPGLEAEEGQATLGDALYSKFRSMNNLFEMIASLREELPNEVKQQEDKVA